MAEVLIIYTESVFNLKRVAQILIRRVKKCNERILPTRIT